MAMEHRTFKNFEELEAFINKKLQEEKGTKKYTVKDAQMEIEEALKNGEGDIYSLINDLLRVHDFTYEEKVYLVLSFTKNHHNWCYHLRKALGLNRKE